MKPVQLKYGYGMTFSACLWLGVFPLLQRGTYASLTRDKWVVMLVLTGVTLLCFCADLLLTLFMKKKPAQAASLPGAGGSSALPAETGGAFRRSGFPAFLLAGALLLWTVLSCLLSSFGPDTWWLGEAARYEGLASQLCYFCIFACFIFSRVSLKPVLLSAAAGVLVFFAVILLQRAGGNPLGLYPSGRSYARNPEFQGTIGNIDMGTGYLLLLSGMFLHALIRSFTGLRGAVQGRSGRSGAKSRSLRLLLLPVVLLVALPVSLFLIITMDVQFGVISLGVLFFLTVLRFVPKKYRLPLLILLVVLALVAVWFWPGQGGGLWELHEIFHGRTRLSFGSNRIAVWNYSLLLAKEDLLLGGGSGTFQARFNRFLADNSLVIPTEQDGLRLPDYFDNPHNEYVAQLTDHGLPGLLLFPALLLFSVFRRRDRCLPLLTPCSAAVLCYSVQAFFSFSVCIVAPMFWMLLGMSFREQE